MCISYDSFFNEWYSTFYPLHKNKLWFCWLPLILQYYCSFYDFYNCVYLNALLVNLFVVSFEGIGNVDFHYFFLFRKHLIRIEKKMKIRASIIELQCRWGILFFYHSKHKISNLTGEHSLFWQKCPSGPSAEFNTKMKFKET